MTIFYTDCSVYSRLSLYFIHSYFIFTTKLKIMLSSLTAERVCGGITALHGLIRVIANQRDYMICLAVGGIPFHRLPYILFCIIIISRPFRLPELCQKTEVLLIKIHEFSIYLK